jgi:hypothetical protein
VLRWLRSFSARVIALGKQPRNKGLADGSRRAQDRDLRKGRATKLSLSVIADHVMALRQPNEHKPRQEAAAANTSPPARQDAPFDGTKRTAAPPGDLFDDLIPTPQRRERLSLALFPATVPGLVPPTLDGVCGDR